jgi:two-component system, cell cycle response regulator DivK
VAARCTRAAIGDARHRISQRCITCDGEAGVSAAKEQRPDLILMDIQLPHMDGYEATRRIKADPELKSIPVIAVTSYALSGDDDKAHAAGCDGYVTKPYSPRQLLEKIRHYLA